MRCDVFCQSFSSHKMKVTLVLLVVVSVAYSAEGRQAVGWRLMKTENLETRLKELVKRKVHHAISNVKSAEYSMQRNAHKAIQSMTFKINSTVASAIGGVNIMRNEAPAECYSKAIKELMDAQGAALANLLSCQQMSQAYEDIEQIAETVPQIIMDIMNDAKIIVEGIADCITEPLFTQWMCAVKYVSKEITNLHNQWPEAKRFIEKAAELGVDIGTQISECLLEPTQVELDNNILKALSDFGACFESSMYVMESFDD